MEKIIAFKSPIHCHFGFNDVTALSLLLKAELRLFGTMGQRSDVMKSKMAVRGKFEKDNRSKLFPFIIIIYCLIFLVQ